MTLYHRTASAEAILANGFRDNTGFYLTTVETTGVWFSDVPLDANEGTKGDIVLAIDVPDDVNLDQWEWIEEGDHGKTYREWQIPAAVVNGFPIKVIDEDETFQLRYGNWYENARLGQSVVIPRG